LTKTRHHHLLLDWQAKRSNTHRCQSKRCLLLLHSSKIKAGKLVKVNRGEQLIELLNVPCIPQLLDVLFRVCLHHLLNVLNFLEIFAFNLNPILTFRFSYLLDLFLYLLYHLSLLSDLPSDTFSRIFLSLHSHL
jgi:hypothetical protein